jgi:hypothetical protein
MQQFYYPRSSRGVLVALLDLFNKIQVYNYNNAGTPVSVIDVPLKYGPSEKYHLFDTQLKSGKKYYPKIPSMLMTLDNITYDSSRSTSVNELRSFYNPAVNINTIDDFWSDVQPAPYNYSYSLEIRTESMDHLFQILENILPFFNPSNHLRVKEFEFLNLERNLAVYLEGTNMDYPKEMGEEESRYFNSTINLNVHGYMYRPIDYAKVIKYIKTSYIYDRINAETFTTSAVPNNEAPPTDFSYKTEHDSTTTDYTKVEDTVIVPNDGTWDGGNNVSDISNFFFIESQPISDINGGRGEFPDSGEESININEYVFIDGTYADNL